MDTCPRCGYRGTPYTQTVSGRRYLYYLHTDGDGRRRCYIGPVEGYVAAARLYQISMPHAFDIWHRLEVLEELLEYFAETCRFKDAESAGDEEKKIREMCSGDGDRRAREECRRAEEERKIREACRGAREAVEEFIKSTG